MGFHGIAWDFNGFQGISMDFMVLQSEKYLHQVYHVYHVYHVRASSISCILGTSDLSGISHISRNFECFHGITVCTTFQNKKILHNFAQPCTTLHIFGYYNIHACIYASISISYLFCIKARWNPYFLCILDHAVHWWWRCGGVVFSV